MEIIATASQLLLDAGANVSAVSPAGHAVLHIAADVGNYALCQTLVQGGADVNVLSSEGITAYGYAKSHLRRLKRKGGGKMPRALSQIHLLTNTTNILTSLGAHTDMTNEPKVGRGRRATQGEG